MIREGQVQILTQNSAIDTHELQDFLSSYAESVAVREFHAGPQANVDWFLPPTIDLVMNIMAAHPYIGGFLGYISAHLTSALAKESLKKISEKFGDAVLGKAVESLWDRLLGAFHRSKQHNATYSRSGKTIPAPPLRFTFALPGLDSLPTVQLQLVFTTELADQDFRAAFALVGKVIERVMQKMEERAHYDRDITGFLAQGEAAKADEILESEHYASLGHTTFTYVYRAGERAWVHADVLAIQQPLESRLEILREMLADPLENSPETVRAMIADIEQQLEDARVR